MVTKTSSVSRKTFVAREDLLNRMAEVAKTQGCSLFELVNDLFQLAIASDELNSSLKRIVEERKVLEMAKNSGFILGLECLWYELADSSYKNDPEAALKSWSDSGTWFAAQYLTGEGSFSFEQFKNDLTALTWNAPEFTIDQEKNKIIVKVTSPRFTEAYTHLFASFLTGAIENFGYQPTRKDVSRGIIRLNATRTVKSK